VPTEPPPSDVHITYSQQYRHCGKPDCPRCAAGAAGHGPYWFAYWREGGHLRSRYLGKQAPVGAPLGLGQGEEPQPPPLPLPAPPGTAGVGPLTVLPAVGGRQDAGGPRGYASLQSSPSEKPPGAQSALRVRTLGGFVVWRGNRSIPASRWTRRAATALFTSLLSAPGYRLHREQVSDWLWPEAEPAASARNLHATLHLLRGVLDDPDTTASVLRLVGEMVVLEPAGGAPPAADWLDAATFARAARAALTGANRADCQAALALYGGDYLPDDPYTEGVITRREELRACYQALLLRLARLSSAVDDLEEAERCLRAVLAVDACHEETAAELMGLLAAQGRRTAALRVYQALATALEADLDVAPNGAIEALRARLLAQEAAPRAADRPPRMPPTTTPTNLPAPLTGFVGRAWERHEVADILAATRLLTLTGPGGCGKTRLALEVAGALVETYPDGVWHVELAMLRDAAILAGVVAGALGVVEQADRLQHDTLRDFLRPRAALLLLDNCEHLIDGCAALATDLLSACPGLRLLTTSREALGVSGETIWRVPGLSVPPADARPEPTSLLRFEAVQLLRARARASRADFALTTGNAPAVMQICQRLDGLPLAIELAAARLATLSVNDVATRLDDCFGLLTGGNRTALPRQQTLRATMEWSYGLLSAEEQRLLRQLSMFAGGCAGEAAVAVCGEEGAPSGAVLDLLGGLVAKSLVGLDDANGTGRYRLLETVRQYGWERLEESGEATETRHKHAAYYLALAEEAEPALTGPDQGRWLQRLDREYDNLRAALRRSRDSREPEIGLRLAAALWRFWYTHGHLSEGRAWLEGFLVAVEPVATALPASVRAAALYGMGVLAWAQGDYDRTTALCVDSLVLCQDLGDRRGIARALTTLGNVAIAWGDYPRARALHEEGLGHRRALGDRWGMALSLHNLGSVATAQGDYARAAALHEESLALRQGLGDAAGIAASLGSLASVATTQGDYARALALSEEGLVVARELGDQRLSADALTDQGRLALARGDAVSALVLIEEGLALYRRLGDQWGIARALAALGCGALARGDAARARAVYQEGLALYQRMDEKAGVATCLEGVAGLAWAEGQPGRAALLYGAAAGLRTAIGAPIPSIDRTAHDHTVTALREALGDDACAAAWAAGQALSLEQAITTALTYAAPKRVTAP